MIDQPGSPSTQPASAQPSGTQPLSPLRALAAKAADDAATLVANPAVGTKWDEPSALDDMTVGALAAHLVRASGAVVAYLDRTDPSLQADDELLTKFTYFHAALDAPIHDQIKKVSAEESTIGHDELAAKAAQVASDLRDRLATEPDDRLVGALGQRMLTLDDFCATRLIEILMHVDDLATSIGVPTPESPAEATGEVIDILVGIARHRHGDWAVIHSLGRAERVTDPAFPVI